MSINSRQEDLLLLSNVNLELLTSPIVQICRGLQSRKARGRVLRRSCSHPENLLQSFRVLVLEHLEASLPKKLQLLTGPGKQWTAGRIQGYRLRPCKKALCWQSKCRPQQAAHTIWMTSLKSMSSFTCSAALRLLDFHLQSNYANFVVTSKSLILYSSSTSHCVY